MNIRTLSGFSDWAYCGGCWGKVGVYRIFDYLKAAGIQDLYWRVFDGGRADYPSRIATVRDGRVYDEMYHASTALLATQKVEHYRYMDYAAYDSLKEAAQAAKECGINLRLWYTLFEDDHGGSVLSDFAQAHPEYWQVDRAGRAYRGTLDWWFPEVRAHKLAIVDELLTNYPEAKGLMLDYVRHNACPSADENGIHRFGYNPEIRAAYKKEFGADPIELPADDARWMAWKVDYWTSFIRDVKKLMNRTKHNQELSLMLWPVEYKTWACIDVSALTQDNTVQMITSMSIKYTCKPQEVVEEYNILKSQTKGDTVKIIPGIISYNKIYSSQLNDCVQTAEQAGIDEVMFYEAPVIPMHGLLTTVRAIQTGKPNYKKGLSASPVTESDPTKIDWSTIPAYTDFFYNTGKRKDTTPSEKTSVQFAYNPKELVIRTLCEDSRMDIALSPIEKKPELQYYLDVLGARTPFFMMNSFNLYLDAKHSHQDYFHFAGLPDGKKIQHTFVLHDWAGEWDLSVQQGQDQWTAFIRIPYASLGIKAPIPGDEWGINMIRGIRWAQETSIWFYSMWQTPYPDDFGHLRFNA